MSNGIYKPAIKMPELDPIPDLVGQSKKQTLSQGLGQAAKTDIGGFGQVAEGLAGIAGGLVGGRARRQEQRAARADLATQRQAYESFQFQDPSRNQKE